MALTISKRIRQSFYLLWLPMPFLLSLVLIFGEGLPWSTGLGFSLFVGIFYAPLAASSYHLCRAMPLQYETWKRTLLTFTVASLILSVSWTAFSLFVEYLLFFDRSSPILSIWPVLLVFGVMGYWLGAAYFYAMLALESSRQEGEKALKAVIAAKEAELKALQFQLRPHFLFNSLNSISASVVRNPKGARRMCVALADFLRATLQNVDRELIPLKEELVLLHNYLMLEKERFADRLQVEEIVDEELSEFLLPSLILQPIVENAIKHGVAQIPEGGWVKLLIEKRDNEVWIQVSNAVASEKANKKPGHGLRLTRDRLRIHYGKAATFVTRQLEDSYEATLTFPLEGAES